MVTICVLEDGKRILSYANGHLILNMYYSKHRSTQGVDDLIPKALPLRLSKLIVKYITLVLPVVRAFLTFRFGPDCVDERRNYREHLFVRSGECFTRDDVTRAIENCTKLYCGGKISVSEWRHVVKALLLYVIGETPDAIRDAMADSEEDDPVNAVFGHSDVVGNREYAVLDGSAPTTNVPYFNRLMNIAYKLHTFFGVGVPQIFIQNGGKIACAPSERGVLSSLISVSFCLLFFITFTNNMSVYSRVLFLA